MMAHELLHQAALIVAAGWMKNENAGVSGPVFGTAAVAIATSRACGRRH